MADLDGIVKLADALRVLDLVGVTGTTDRAGTVQLDIYLADGDRHVIHTSGFMDGKNSLVWVQLPLDIAEAIVCQAEERLKGAELDRRLLPGDADPRLGASNRPPKPAQRRAPDLCDWHDGFHTVKRKPKAGSFAYCFECSRYIPREGKNAGKEFPTDFFDEEDDVVSATLVDVPRIRLRSNQ